MESQKPVVTTRELYFFTSQPPIPLYHPLSTSVSPYSPPNPFLCFVPISSTRSFLIIPSNNPRIICNFPSHSHSRFFEKKNEFSFPIHSSLFIRIFHSHPFPHSFTPTLSSSLTLGRRRKRRAGRRGRYFHTSMSLSLPMLGLARRRSRSRLVFLGMGMALGVGTALLLLFGFVVIPSGDERVDLFFQKVVSWKKRRGKRRKKKTYKTDIFKQIRKDPNRPLHRQHRHTPKHQSHHRQP